MNFGFEVSWFFLLEIENTLWVLLNNFYYREALITEKLKNMLHLEITIKNETFTINIYHRKKLQVSSVTLELDSFTNLTENLGKYMNQSKFNIISRYQTHMLFVTFSAQILISRDWWRCIIYGRPPNIWYNSFHKVATCGCAHFQCSWVSYELLEIETFWNLFIKIERTELKLFLWG